MKKISGKKIAIAALSLFLAGKALFAFEPDKTNLNKIKSGLRYDGENYYVLKESSIISENDKRITLNQKGLWVNGKTVMPKGFQTEVTKVLKEAELKEKKQIGLVNVFNYKSTRGTNCYNAWSNGEITFGNYSIRKDMPNDRNWFYDADKDGVKDEKEIYMMNEFCRKADEIMTISGIKLEKSGVIVESKTKIPVYNETDFYDDNSSRLLTLLIIPETKKTESTQFYTASYPEAIVSLKIEEKSVNSTNELNKVYSPESTKAYSESHVLPSNSGLPMNDVYPSVKPNKLPQDFNFAEPELEENYSKATGKGLEQTIVAQKEETVNSSEIEQKMINSITESSNDNPLTQEESEEESVYANPTLSTPNQWQMKKDFQEELKSNEGKTFIPGVGMIRTELSDETKQDLREFYNKKRKENRRVSFSIDGVYGLDSGRADVEAGIRYDFGNFGVGAKVGIGTGEEKTESYEEEKASEITGRKCGWNYTYEESLRFKAGLETKLGLAKKGDKSKVAVIAEGGIVYTPIEENTTEYIIGRNGKVMSQTSYGESKEKIDYFGGAGFEFDLTKKTGMRFLVGGEKEKGVYAKLGFTISTN